VVCFCRMKIIMTNDEWNNAPWWNRGIAVIAGNAVLLLVLAGCILLALLGWHFLTAIPLKIYLAIIIVILLVIVLRKRSVAG
jgi:hypothetical protein